MALDFPTSPSVGDTYSFGGRTWKWNGTGWQRQSSATFTASSTAPTTPAAGDEWLDLSTGIDYRYVNDGNTSQWVEMGPTSVTTMLPLLTPQGRLSNLTATPVQVATTSGATSIYYTPYNGNQVPIYDGTNWISTSFSELSQALTDTTKSPAATGTFGSATNIPAAYDLFAWNDAGTMRCTRGPAWSYSSTVTFTDAGDLVNWTAHGLVEGQVVVFTTTGTLPTGLSPNIAYFVTRSPAANTFTVSTSIANAAAGTINTFTTGSGTHTATVYDKSRGTGAGTTELTRVNGIYLNANAITNGPGAQRGTYVGSIRTNGSSTLDYVVGGVASGCTEAQIYVWNMYNRVPIPVAVMEDATSWTYSTTTVRCSNNSTTARISVFRGLNEDAISASIVGLVQSNGATVRNCIGGFGLDKTDTNDQTISSPAYTSVTTTVPMGFTATMAGALGLGYHYIQWTEYGAGTDTQTWFGDGAVALYRSGLHGVVPA